MELPSPAHRPTLLLLGLLDGSARRPQLVAESFALRSPIRPGAGGIDPSHPADPDGSL